MKKTVTITDIANSLGISRNTVSKALNGQHVMPKTKQAIINAAIKMGYKSYDVISNSQIKGQGRILILSSVPLLSSTYYIYLLKGLSNAAERNGIEVVQYFFRPNANIESLKSYISQFEVNGIICIEFFDQKMFSEIISLDVPTLFLDYPTNECNLNGNYDILLSESITSVSNVCCNLIKKGLKKFTFVGNPNNCRSFYERYLGLREALYKNNLPCNDNNSILDQNIAVYGNIELLAEKINNLAEFPDCFVCANDYIALKIIEALKYLKVKNFEKINIIGFDNSPESKLCTPKLSTFNIDKTTLGINAVYLLSERMTKKKLPVKIIYMGTKFINRETTFCLNT